MNKAKKLFNVLLLLSFVTLLSCERDDINPTKPTTFGKLEIVRGDNQTGYFGELLSDSIIIKASSNNAHKSYLIKYERVQGNGSIERGYYGYKNGFFIDETGILKIEWRLGCDYNIQKIKLILYVEETRNKYGYINYYSEPSDSIIISASGIKPTGWVRSCGCEDLGAFFPKIVSFDESILYLVSRGFYSSIDNGLNWNKVEGVPDWENIVDAQFNSLGWLYLLTENNGVCYSKDLQNWEYINNGILDPRNPTSFLVEDSTLFVSFYFDGLYKTSDNGGFWKKMLIDGHERQFYHITRHPNGDIYLIDKWDNLWISKDYGKLWGKVDIEYKYVDAPIHDLEISKNGLIYIGADDATISEVNSTSYQGDIHSYYERNGSTQHVDNITIKHGDVFYLVKGSPKSGIYSKSNNWSLINVGFNKRINYFYLKSDNTFMILSSDGLYYFN